MDALPELISIARLTGVVGDKDIYEHLGDDLVTTEIKVTADSGANHQRCMWYLKPQTMAIRQNEETRRLQAIQQKKQPL